MELHTSLPQPLTLAEQVTGIIRQGMREGFWGEFLPGEVELSHTLHVSRMTLRASLATLKAEGLLAVSRGRKSRILATPEKHTPARPIVLLTRLPLESMMTLHILVVDGLREQFAQAGYPLEVHPSPGVFSASPASFLERLVAQKPAAAWLLLNSSPQMQRWFMNRQLPCVIIGAVYPGITIPSLGTDYRLIGQHAAGVFLRRGHRKLLLIVPNDGRAGHVNTEVGFRAAAAAVSGASVRVMTHRGAPEALARAVVRLQCQHPATALLVALPPWVLTVISALADAGFRTPRDYSLIARDSDAHLDFLIPAPARYEINVAQYVRRIARAVLLVARGSMPRVREQLLRRDFIAGATVGDVSAQ